MQSFETVSDDCILTAKPFASSSSFKSFAFNSLLFAYKIPIDKSFVSILDLSDNKGLFYITHSAENPKDQRVLSVGVHHKNSDRMTSNILLKGTKEEILAYLKSEENTQTLIDTINHLSDKTDEYYSSL